MGNLNYIVASDVSSRDGVGLEVYLNDECIIEIFRDDTKRTRTITLFQEDVSVEIVEQSIKDFKKRGLWDFQD